MEALSRILNELIEQFLASDKRGILLNIVTIVALFVVKAVSTRPIKAYVYKRALKQENAANFMTTWRFFWFALIAIFGIISLSG